MDKNYILAVAFVSSQCSGQKIELEDFKAQVETIYQKLQSNEKQPELAKLKPIDRRKLGF